MTSSKPNYLPNTPSSYIVLSHWRLGLSLTYTVNNPSAIEMKSCSVELPERLTFFFPLETVEVVEA